MWLSGLVNYKPFQNSTCPIELNSMGIYTVDSKDPKKLSSYQGTYGVARDISSRKKAEKLRGDADGEATKIYANAYQRDPEFYSFLNSLASYRASLSADTTLVLTTETDYLRYLQDLSPQR